MTVEDSSVPQTPLVTLAVAAFSAGAYSPSLRGLAIVLGGVVVAEPSDAIVQVPLFAAIWAGGRLALRYRLQASRLAELTEALERGRAEHARLAILEERSRIARELHDVVAHALSTMIVQAGAERLSLGARAEGSTAEALAGIEQTGREALGDMRRLLGMLRADDQSVALAPRPSLEHLSALSESMRRAGLHVDVAVEGDAVRLPPGVDMSAYRIVQEALTNALRHSSAGRAQVRIRYRRADIEIEVIDEGPAVGTTGANGAGYGLTGMRERVALYGGELQAGAAGAGGWALRARLPLGTAA